MDCPKCATSIPATDVNVAALVAKCTACDHVFQFQATSLAASGAPATFSSPPRPPKIQLSQPDRGPILGPAYREQGGAAPREFTLSKRWMNHTVWFMAFFCVAWDGFLVNWYWRLASGESGTFSLIGALFPIIHVSIGVGLTYSVLATFLNTTTVRLTADTLDVKHGPLPWRGTVTTPRAMVHGVVVREKKRKGISPPQLGGSYGIALDIDGVSKLVGGVFSEDEAEYVAWQLRDALDV